VTLSDEQRAMMRLLAQRDVGYEDVASLMGISVEEVERKVQEALAEMDEPGEAPSAPEGRSQPARRARRARRPLPRPRLGVPDERRRFVILTAGSLAAVGVLLLVVYQIAGSGGGGTASAEPAAEGVASANITQAALEPVGDSEAHGRALFGRIRNTAVLQVQAEGLEPSPPGKSYTVWLYRSPKLALRVGSVKVKNSGLGAQFPLPNELLGILAQGAFDRVNVSLTDDSAYKAEISRAKKEKRLPAYSGTTVLSGEITGSLVKKKG
jgi:hypothetical protein